MTTVLGDCVKLELGSFEMQKADTCSEIWSMVASDMVVHIGELGGVTVDIIVVTC